MKKILFCLFLCLFFQLTRAQEYKSINTIEPGDWLLVEHTEYYPYVPPGVQEETPWRAENIRRVVMKAVVTARTNENISFDYYIDHVYDCRNLEKENAVKYYNSRYTKDSPFFDWNPVPSDSVLANVTYNISSGEIKSLNKQQEHPYITYGTIVLSIGLANKIEKSNRHPGVLDGNRIPHKAMPLLLSSWNHGAAITSSIRLDAAPEFKRAVYTAELGRLPEDVTHNQLSSETRVIGASFPLPPNVKLVYTQLGESSMTNKNIRRFFIPYPTEYYIENERMNHEEFPWLISPGDSIERKVLANGSLSFTGKGSIQNKVYHQKKYFASKVNEDQLQQMDVYWRQTFELNERYRQAQRCFYKREQRAIDPANDCFSTLIPLTDGWYNPPLFKEFLDAYLFYKKNSSLTESLTFSHGLIYPTNRQNYYNNKLFLIGYPRYLMNADIILHLMNTNMLAENSVEYNEFIEQCPDNNLLNKVKYRHNVLLELEKGKNIKNSRITFAKDILPTIAKRDKYLLITIVPTNYYNSLYHASFNKKLVEAGLHKNIKEFNSYPGTPPYYYTQEDVQFMDSLFTYVDKKEVETIMDYYSYGRNPITVLVRQDGTILYRYFGAMFPERKIIEIVKADMNRSGSDFWKGFKRGLFITLAVGLLIFIVVKIRLDSKRRKELFERHIKELEVKAIRSQMNPHFMFNALGSIQNLIGKGANDEANDYLVHFSRLLRMVLNNSEKKLIPLSEELDQIYLYLKLEQLRIPFKFSIQTEPEISPDVIEIPGMLIQPFVENAVKHAIAPKGGGKLLIGLKLVDDKLIVEVVDDGPGIQASPTEGFGTKAITEELKLLSVLNGKEIKLEIKNRQDEEEQTGCRVTLFIPVM